jgi:hypothetical protein
VVARDEKRRFSFDDTGLLIRANQGHSVPVDLDLEESEPPAVLYHGTGERLAGAIAREGLRRMRRHHVHLSPDVPTARAVGARHGRPVLRARRERGDEVGEVGVAGAQGVRPGALQVGAELEEVGPVGLERVAGEPALELEVGQEVEHEVLERLGRHGTQVRARGEARHGGGRRGEGGRIGH